MDVKALEYHRLSQETSAHDKELPDALENHNAVHSLRESKHVKANENFWIKFPMNKNGWTRDWGFATGESPAEPRKTLTPVFQYRTWLNNEKQSKH